MSELSVNHLLGIKYITKADIDLIFETADHFKEVINRPIKKVPSLRDITIANLFFENSTRTKLSFELAEKRLSADVRHGEQHFIYESRYGCYASPKSGSGCFSF